MIQSRPLIDHTTGQRRSKRRHFEDSMVAEEWKGSNGVRLRRLIRSYRSQDSFPRKPSITVLVTLHVTTFVIPLSSCFMITIYHAIVTQARDISQHHHTLCAANAVFFPMHSFSLCFIFSFRLTRLADPALVISVLTNRMQYRPHGSP